MTVVLSVVGARPNFMKLAPIARVLGARPDVRHGIVHTGQHYDAAMSDAFLTGLDIPTPAYNLAVGSGTQAQQTAAVMERFEPVCAAVRPDVVLVYGDVTSTLAAALVAAKLGIRVGHVEAGLRSRDWTMPEEINRVLTDRLSDLLFIPSRDARANLVGEGIAPARIHFVGNIMVDTLMALLPRARRGNGNGGGNGAGNGAGPHGAAPYIVVTLHRPANVDDPAVLRELLGALGELAAERRVLFPMHPRTRARLGNLGWEPRALAPQVELLDPVPYLDMLKLVVHSDLVITDSGGLQEETTVLGVPCLTVRPNTERPITCTQGTNRLVAPGRPALVEAARQAGRSRQAAAERAPIERWDGRTAERIAAVLCDGVSFSEV